ncbi:hypothetical protein ACFQNE_16510 [Gordonia phosphorivorans]|uniref:DUF4333 domain-containing protein n=1 Tax=Gordonia phosphorivorans TaxID=1056982 RepID=A0ABV6HBT3_9ACTN
MNSRRVRQVLVAGLAGAALAVTGCSASVQVGGSPDSSKPAFSTKVSFTEKSSKLSLPKETVEEYSAKQLAKDPNNLPEIRCDGGLEGTIGYTQACQVQILGEWYPYTATVVSVVDDRINWRIVADDPASIPQ